MTALAAAGEMRSKPTHRYCEEYLSPVLQDSIRRSIINAETGGATKRNTRMKPAEKVTKATKTINKAAIIRRMRIQRIDDTAVTRTKVQLNRARPMNML